MRELTCSCNAGHRAVTEQLSCWARQRCCHQGNCPDTPFSSTPPVLKREPFTRLPHAVPDGDMM